MTTFLSMAAAGAAFELVLRATLLMGAAWLFASALRKGGAPAAARHMVWLLCILGLLVLPILWWLVPALRLPILPVEAATLAAPITDPAPSPAAVTEFPSGSREYEGWGATFLLVYVLVATSLLMRLVLGRLLLARLWREARTASDRTWDPLLSKLLSEMRLPRKVDVRISARPIMPMTWGTLRPKVLLPAEADAWDSQRQRLVLLHELAHVARCDSLGRTTASLACALYWFHPGSWFAARQMRLEQEHAADDRVLTAGEDAEDYAFSLLHLAKTLGEQSHHGLAATMAGACQLEQRIVSITSQARRDSTSTVFFSSSALVAALATLLAAAGVPVGPLEALRSVSDQRPSGLEATPDKSRSSEPSAPVRQGEMAWQRSAAPSPAQGGALAARESAAASELRPQPLSGNSSGDEQGAIARRADVAAPRSELESSGKEDRNGRSQTVGNGWQLADYNWQLPQRAPLARPASLPTPSAPTGVAGPPQAYTAPKEANGPSKRTQAVPRLLLAGAPSPGPLATPQRKVMLSWSLDVGP